MQFFVPCAPTDGAGSSGPDNVVATRFATSSVAWPEDRGDGPGPPPLRLGAVADCPDKRRCLAAAAADGAGGSSSSGGNEMDAAARVVVALHHAVAVDVADGDANLVGAFALPVHIGGDVAAATRLAGCVSDRLAAAPADIAARVAGGAAAAAAAAVVVLAAATATAPPTWFVVSARQLLLLSRPRGLPPPPPVPLAFPLPAPPSRCVDDPARIPPRPWWHCLTVVLDLDELLAQAESATTVTPRPHAHRLLYALQALRFCVFPRRLAAVTAAALRARGGDGDAAAAAVLERDRLRRPIVEVVVWSAGARAHVDRCLHVLDPHGVLIAHAVCRGRAWPSPPHHIARKDVAALPGRGASTIVFDDFVGIAAASGRRAVVVPAFSPSATRAAGGDTTLLYIIDIVASIAIAVAAAEEVRVSEAAAEAAAAAAVSTRALLPRQQQKKWRRCGGPAAAAAAATAAVSSADAAATATAAFAAIVTAAAEIGAADDVASTMHNPDSAGGPSFAAACESALAVARLPSLADADARVALQERASAIAAVAAAGGGDNNGVVEGGGAHTTTTRTSSSPPPPPATTTAAAADRILAWAASAESLLTPPNDGGVLATSTVVGAAAVRALGECRGDGRALLPGRRCCHRPSGGSSGNADDAAAVTGGEAAAAAPAASQQQQQEQPTQLLQMLSPALSPAPTAAAAACSSSSSNFRLHDDGDVRAIVNAATRAVAKLAGSRSAGSPASASHRNALDRIIAVGAAAAAAAAARKPAYRDDDAVLRGARAQLGTPQQKRDAFDRAAIPRLLRRHPFVARSENPAAAAAAASAPAEERRARPLELCVADQDIVAARTERAVNAAANAAVRNAIRSAYVAAHQRQLQQLSSSRK